MTHTNHSSGIRAGLIVFSILAALTAIEFLLAIFLNVWLLLALVALMKAGLVAYYYMHISRLFEPGESDDRESYPYKLATNRIGLWLFFISDFFIFGGLLNLAREFARTYQTGAETVSWLSGVGNIDHLLCICIFWGDLYAIRQS